MEIDVTLPIEQQWLLLSCQVCAFCAVRLAIEAMKIIRKLGSEKKFSDRTRHVMKASIPIPDSSREMGNGKADSLSLYSLQNHQ